MDSHAYHDKYYRYDCLVAANAHTIFSPAEDILAQLDNFYAKHNDWIFGHLGYDLKNEIDGLQSIHDNKIGFPDVFFFVPSVVLILKGSMLAIESIAVDPGVIFNEITAEIYVPDANSVNSNIQLNAALSKPEYVEAIQKLQQHILRGDCYEINFCQEFFAENINIYPLVTYIKLLEISPTPFSCFYKLNDRYLLCASPERFLSKINNTIFSQPIKGTAPRGENEILDKIEKDNLSRNKKEQSENVMIVDLVRNDLSKICIEGSVEAEELFAVYSFPQVHQMISTV